MANKMENVVDLAKFIDQRVRVQFQVISLILKFFHDHDHDHYYSNMKTNNL